MALKTKEIQGFKMYYSNEREFNVLYNEVFVNEEYKTTLNKPNPTIIDCGSHIGLSIFYFKKQYPQAKVLGFEPHPETFTILQKNVFANRLREVSLVNRALADREGRTNLFLHAGEAASWRWDDTTTENIWDWQNNPQVQRILVPTARLSSYITQPVDLIKMDIEGSEQKVLTEIESKFGLVRRLIIEVHQTPNSKNVNQLNTIVRILKRNHYQIEITPKDYSNWRLWRKANLYLLRLLSIRLFWVKHPLLFLVRAKARGNIDAAPPQALL